MKTIKIILLAFIVGIGCAIAQQPAIVTSDKTGWHKIAETTVDFKKERDEVGILMADRFAKIKIKVTDAPLQLEDLEIFYESGDIQKVPVRSAIEKMGESRTIDLEGGERDLTKVVLVYKTIPNAKDEKAHVEIWGLKTNTDEKSAAKKSDYDKDKNGTVKSDYNKDKSVTVKSDYDKDKNVTMKSDNDNQKTSVMVNDSKGWHKIGERPVDFVKDRDEIIVTGADRFSAIKFKVTEASIQLNSLEVFYETGDTQKIPVASPIMAGTESRVIDLNGGERDLKKIVFEYKTVPNQTAEKAVVEVWGMKKNMATK
jgi:hypothetical protein